MTKTWLWFRIETDTESKNGCKFRPDTKSNQNQQIFQKNQISFIIFPRIFVTFLENLLAISSSAGSYADTKT